MHWGSKFWWAEHREIGDEDSYIGTYFPRFAPRLFREAGFANFSRQYVFIERQAAKREKWQARLDWAAQQIRLRGGVLLITARFIPGGRSVLTISSGITRQPKAWFMGWIGLAAAIWATYAAGLGYFGGKAFDDDHTKAFIVAFSAALGMTLIVEVVRHFRSRTKPKVDLEVGS